MIDIAPPVVSVFYVTLIAWFIFGNSGDPHGSRFVTNYSRIYEDLREWSFALFRLNFWFNGGIKIRQKLEITQSPWQEFVGRSVPPYASN